MSQFLAIFISRKVDSFPSMFYVAFKTRIASIAILASYYGIVFFGRENALFSAFLRKTLVAKFIAAISWMLVQFQLVQFSMLL